MLWPKKRIFSQEIKMVKRDPSLDNAAIDPSEDRFNRASFCEALAKRLASMGSKEGAVVVGLYGRWGYGKSSVLNFIRSYLTHDHGQAVAIMEFNPWRFSDEATLLQDFYLGLGGTLQRTVGLKGRIGDLLTTFGDVLSAVPIMGSGAVGKAVGKFGKLITGQPIEALYHEAFEILSSIEKSIVILIDDLDRLDRDELMAMLKLVRLNGNLPNLIYVMAFDDDAVSAVAGSSPQIGQQYLQKIVQYPYFIPAIGQRHLVNYVTSQAHAATEKAGVKVSDDDWIAFRIYVDKLLASRLATPRQAIRFGSAIEFAFAALKAEVDPLHQMMIEGIRVAVPELYKFVRDNGNDFTSSSSEEGADAFMKAFRNAYPGPSEGPEREMIGALINPGSSRSRSINRVRYFDRYFSYTLSQSDISEADVEELLGYYPRAKLQLLQQRIKRVADRAPAALIELLLEKANGFRAHEAEQIALAIANCGQALLSHRDLGTSNLQLSFLYLIVKLIDGSVYDADFSERSNETSKLAIEIIKIVEPISVLPLLFSAFRTGEPIGTFPAVEPIVDPDHLDLVLKEISARILAYASHSGVELLQTDNSLKGLCDLWISASAVDVKRWFRGIVEERPMDLYQLLDSHHVNVTVGEWNFSRLGFWIDPDFLKETITTTESMGLSKDQSNLAKHCLLMIERRLEAADEKKI